MQHEGVPLLQDDDPIPVGSAYCTWMPYQKAVASGAIPPVLHPGQDEDKAREAIGKAT